MSEESERVYTINLGKVLLSQSQHRAVRAINMIREFARHHMKVQEIKIEEELAQLIWARGVRRPPRKVRVRMNTTDEGYILVSAYDEELEARLSSEKQDSGKSSKTASKPSATTETASKPSSIPEPVDEPSATTETASEPSDATNPTDESKAQKTSDKKS